MLFLNGTFAEALPYLEKAVQVEPNSAEAHQFLAEVYSQLGQEANAAREHAEAERLNSSSRP
jgi:Tfp pilus assembly protein PilF